MEPKAIGRCQHNPAKRRKRGIAAMQAVADEVQILEALLRDQWVETEHTGQAQN